MTLVGIIIIAVLAFVLGARVRKRRPQVPDPEELRVFQVIARAHGFQPCGTRDREVQAVLKGVRLHFWEEDRPTDSPRCVLTATGPANPLELWRLTPAIGRSALTGDELFDRQVAIGSDPVLALAVLGPAVRELLHVLRCGEWLQAGAFFKNGTLTIVHPGRLEAGDLSGWAASLGAAVKQLAPPANLEEALLGRFRAEPRWEVRVQILARLQERFPGDPEVEKLLREQLANAKTRERLAIAREVHGPVTEQLLYELAEAEDWAGVPAEDRRDALQTLVYRGGPREVMTRIVLRGLRSRERPVRLAALEAVNELSLTAAVDPLCNLMTGTWGVELEQIADTLGWLADGRAEPPLLRLLLANNPGAQRGAARALGQLGTARALEPLGALAAAPRVDQEARQAARSALRSIQNRLGLHGQGGLRLVESGPATGAVAVATQPGALAMSEREGPPAC